MNNIILKQTLSTIHNFEQYEQCKEDIAESLARTIIDKHLLPEASLTLFAEGTNIVFLYDDSKVIKIFPPFHQNQFDSERLVLKHLDGKLTIITPTLEYEGEVFEWPYFIINKLEGTLLETLWDTMPQSNKAVILQELGELIREVHTLSTDGLESIDSHWPQFIEKQIAHCVEQHQAKGLEERLIHQLPEYLNSVVELLPKLKKPVLLTGEYTPMNFLVKQENGIWHISGLIDFGDAMLGLPEYDLLGPGAFLIRGDKELLRTFLMAYGYLPQELTNTLSRQMTALMLLHQYSNLNIQVRIPNWQAQVTHLHDLEHLVWGC